MGKDLFQDHEKRKFDRDQLLYYVRVNYHKTNILAGYLADISTEGLMLFSKDSVKKDVLGSFQINLDEEFGMDEKLVFEARCVWCRPDANPEYFITGFEFSGLDQAGIDTVKYLIQKYGFAQ
ncbi:MAG: PilZ domain-containing protein [Desulfobacula sp.]|nr:PilZ domain-containing protein [Desulfobacula sp.]